MPSVGSHEGWCHRPPAKRLITGPFRIYRAPGSVAFLNCGAALQPILPKSQCWCIDETSSKFVLQIRRPQFWRIEVPTGSAEDDRRATSLRDVLDKVLQFEKTPCPFQRGFTVPLPERPQTPVKKRPWTPVKRSVVQFPPTPVTPAETPPSRLRRQRTPSPEPSSDSGVEPSRIDVVTRTLDLVEQVGVGEPASDRVTEYSSPLLSATDSRNRSPSPDALLPSLAGRFTSFRAARSVTAPPQLTLPVSPPSKSAGKTTVDQPFAATALRGSTSPTESSDSFHSIQSWHSPIALPSPPASDPGSPTVFPYPHDNIPKPLISHHREISDATITPVDNGTWMLSPTGADLLSLESSSDTSSVYEEAGQPNLEPRAEEAGPVVADGEAASSPAGQSTAVPPRPRIRHRSTASSMSVSTHRALSPLPPAANLFTPHRQFPRYSSSRRAVTRLEAVQRLPAAIIHKTCEIIMAPPRELLALMLSVAAKIAAGEWRGLVFGTGDGGESIPVHWDYSDEDGTSWALSEADAPGGLWSTHADLFGRDGKASPADDAIEQQRAEDASRSWEVD